MMKIRCGAKDFRCCANCIGEKGVALNVVETGASHLTPLHANAVNAEGLPDLARPVQLVRMT